MFRSKLTYNYLVFGLPIFMIAALALLTTSSEFRENTRLLSIGISIDLLLIIPLVYLILIRNTQIPKTTIIPLLVLGLIVGKTIIPGEHQYYLDLFKNWALPVLELSVLGYIIYNVRKAFQSFKLNKKTNKDFYSILKITCKDILPKPLVIPFITEIAVFYYGFVEWKRRELKDNEFHYHKESGSVSLLAVLIFLITIETLVLHILLAMWNGLIAWILTFLSLYSIIQIFGFLRSMSKRPIIIEDGELYLRYGIMNEAVVDLKDIRSIEISTKDIELNSETKKLSFLGSLESHNLILHLNKEYTLTGLYGRKSKFTTLAFHVDDKHDFKQYIETIAKGSIS